MTAIANIEQITSFGKENVDALVQSTTLAVKGLEELAKAYSSLANTSIEQTSTAIKALSTAKNPAEFTSIYNSVAKANFDVFVSDSRKIQELTSQIMTNSFAPLNARIQALSSLVKAA